MYEWRLETGELIWDERVRQFWGVGPDEPLSYDLFLQGIHPDDREAVLTLIDAALTQGDPGPYHAEYRIVGLENGAERWVLSTGLVEHTDDRPARLVGVVKDITKRKQAELKLQESEAQFRAMFESTAVGMAQADPASGTLLRANQTLANMLGYTVEELVGKPFTLVTHPDDREEDWARFKRMVSGEVGVYTSEKRYVRKDGAVIWALASATLVKTDAGQPVRTVAVIQDITERKLGEAALRASEQRFRQVVQSLPHLVWTCAPDGLFDYLGPQWIAFTGIPAERQLGSGWLDQVHPDERGPMLAQWRRAALAGRNFSAECRIRRADGEYRWFYTLAVPLLDEEGRIVKWFGTNTDITEKKQAADAQRDLDRRKDEFLAILGHELRNPLAAVSNAVAVLSRGPEQDESGVAPRLLDVIQRQTKHLNRLVDDLLEASRISEGKIELQRENLCLRDAVLRGIELSGPLLAAQRHNLRVSDLAEDVRVNGDPVRLAQIVSNLLDNAAKYTPSRGNISVTLGRDGPWAIITVQDDGIGMTSDMLPHVFDMFAQAREATGRDKSGLGIGLALVRGLVELHGGKVEAFSEGPGKGSTFRVWLPVVDDAEQTAGARACGAPRRDHAIRALVIDDDPSVADTFGMLLEALGAEAWVVYSGKDALDVIARFQPVAIFIDLSMPGMDGFETARRIRQSCAGRPKLYALSGWGSDENRRRSEEAGFDAHFVKPIDAAALQELLATLAA